MNLKNSMILANMMSSKKEKTLNLVSVGGATYDSNYIFENDGSNKFFETLDKISFSTNDEFVIKVKFFITQNQNNGIFRSYDLNHYSGEFGIFNNNKDILSVMSTYVYQGTFYTNVWINCLIEHKKSEDTLHYVVVDENNIKYVENNMRVSSSKDLTGKYKFGSYNNDHNIYGKIDFKETDIIINGQSVLWV